MLQHPWWARDLWILAGTLLVARLARVRVEKEGLLLCFASHALLAAFGGPRCLYGHLLLIDGVDGADANAPLARALCLLAAAVLSLHAYIIGGADVAATWASAALAVLRRAAKERRSTPEAQLERVVGSAPGSWEWHGCPVLAAAWLAPTAGARAVGEGELPWFCAGARPVAVFVCGRGGDDQAAVYVLQTADRAGVLLVTASLSGDPGAAGGIGMVCVCAGPGFARGWLRKRAPAYPPAEAALRLVGAAGAAAGARRALAAGAAQEALGPYSRAAVLLQREWRRAVADPGGRLCRRRLMREFDELACCAGPGCKI